MSIANQQRSIIAWSIVIQSLVKYPNSCKQHCLTLMTAGFQLNIQELQTVVRNRLPLKIVVMNNRSQGMIRQFQETYFGERYQSSLWGYSTPDFVRVARAYDIPGRTVENSSECDSALRW